MMRRRINALLQLRMLGEREGTSLVFLELYIHEIGELPGLRKFLSFLLLE